MKSLVLIALMTAHANAQPIEVAAMVGHASSYSDDGDVDVRGKGIAGEIDVVYRPLRWFSVGPYLGFARNADPDVGDPIDHSYFAVDEQINELGLRFYVHLGPCFAGIGGGRQNSAWNGEMSVTSYQLGCTYQHVQVAYVLTKARSLEWVELEQESTRILIGARF